jgi:hypothetical protein
MARPGERDTDLAKWNWNWIEEYFPSHWSGERSSVATLLQQVRESLDLDGVIDTAGQRICCIDGRQQT